jgi:spermidine/putrescine transport system permease protein
VARTATTASGAQRGRWWTPYALLWPGLTWLALFFLVPLATLWWRSREAGAGAYLDAITDNREVWLRTVQYSAIATVAALLIGYPLAYVIAFRSGRYKTLLLGLVVLPFFTTYLLRTFAWKILLGDDGNIASFARDVPVLHVNLLSVLELVHLTTDDQRLTATSLAVVGGLVYNYLPFLILPIFVSLEKIDRRLVEAGLDLYSSGSRTFRKVVLPLSMPGLFAGTLLFFIPVMGDFINATLLGSPQNQMIGNVIQYQFLTKHDYAVASATSFVLMIGILIAVLMYIRALGTEDLM